MVFFLKRIISIKFVCLSHFLQWVLVFLVNGSSNHLQMASWFILDSMVIHIKLM
jgi:hypothetical protein